MEQDLTSEWIGINEAAAMLAGTQDDLRRLIRMRRIQCREADDAVRLDDVITVLELREFDAVMDAGGSEKEARKRAEAVRARWEAGESHTEPAQNDSSVPSVSLVPSVPSAPPTPSPIYSSNLIAGQNVVSLTNAARALGIGLRHAQTLLQSGRLSWSQKVGRVRYVLLSEVQAYKRLQSIWEAKGGRWTPYGRYEQGVVREKMEEKDPALLRKKKPRHATHNTVGPDDQHIRASEAAALLNVNKLSVDRMARQGKLARRMEIGKVRSKSGNRVQRIIGLYSLRQVLDLAAERERKSPRISPGQWNRDLRHPVVRTEVVPPPGDRLIPSAEAAALLGIPRPAISRLVISGRLFAWQKEPGKRGSKVWLSERQVLRYRDDPERIRRRRARLSASTPEGIAKRRANRPWPPLYPESNYDEFMMKYNLEPGDWRHQSRRLQKDWGEFFTTRQAALELGVTPAAVRTLRVRGRLRGFQKPRVKWDGGGKKWWFYRKDDVYDLLADGQYLKQREKGKRIWMACMGE